MPLAALPAPIPSHALLVFLLQIGVLLLLALVLGRLAARFGMPAVVGELCAGVLLGPTVFDHVAPGLSAWLIPKTDGQFHLLDAVGQIGVVLLVGITGIEVDVKLLRRKGATALRIGMAGLIIPLGLGIAVGYLAPPSLPAHGDRNIFALFVGVAMCVSALPVIAKALADMNLLHRNVGQLTVAASVVDDAVGWLLLSVVSVMATTGFLLSHVGLSVLSLGLVILVAATVGRPVVGLALRWANRTEGSAATVAVAVIVIVLGAAVTQALGMEAVFGAFVCGLLIGTRKELNLARLAPLRTAVMAVFAPLFFATVGLRIDLTVLRNPVVLVASVVMLLVAVVGKFAGAFLGGLISRLTRWESLAVGAGMNARGVIQIVVATVGLRTGVLTTETYTMIILVAISTSLMAPPILRIAMRRIEHTDEERIRERSRASFGDAGALAERQP